MELGEKYDDASWHFEGDFPDDLDEFQSNIHCGLYLAWLIERDLLSTSFLEEAAGHIARFHNRELTGPQILQQFDGKLFEGMLNSEGNAFTRYYYSFEHGQFVHDYDTTLGGDLPSLYHVLDSWQNYQELKEVLDRRFEDWRHSR